MYSEIASNKRKTVGIMVLFILFVGLLGLGLAYWFGVTPYMSIGVLIGAMVYSIIMYFAGGRLSLAVNGAAEIKKSDNPRLWRIIENLAITEGLPMPRVFIMQDPAPNAFATGRNPDHAAVCATTGILEIMNDTELEGVFAHELSHIKNYDIRVSMIAFALTAVVSLIADVVLHTAYFRGNNNEGGGSNPVFLVIGIAGAILAPLIATLIQLSISRKREYLADATGALATRYPEGLASALEKLEQFGRPLRKQNTSTAHLFFANPLKRGALAGLFSTHPPLQDRINRLRNMGRHA